MGYAYGVKGYHFWCPNLKKVIISRDVIFNESALLHLEREAANSSSSHAGDNLENVAEKVEFELEVPNGSQQDISSSFSSPPLEMPDSTMHDSDDAYYSIARDKPRREIKRLRRYSEVDLVASALTVAEETSKGGEPQTYSEVVSCPNSSKWLVAMHEEI